MTSTALMGYGEMKRREEAAKQRGKRFQVDPQVRENRARMLEEREAALEQAEVEAQARQEANPTALASVLARGTLDELAEITRSIGRMDPRKIQEVADEIFRAKSRSQAYRPDDETTVAVASSTDLAEIAVGAGGSARASRAAREAERRQ